MRAIVVQSANSRGCPVGTQAVRLLVRREGVVDPFRAFGQVAVGVVLQPAVHMAEAVLVGHELNMPFTAIGVEQHDLFAREGAGILPDDLVAPVGEGMLGIELELVHLETGQQVDQLVERLHGRDAVAGDVEHDAALRVVRPVFDLHGGQHDVAKVAGVHRDQLPQGRCAVEEPGGVSGGDEDAIPADHQPVALRARTDGGIHVKGDFGFAGGRCRDRGDDAEGMAILLQPVGAEQQGLRILRQSNCQRTRQRDLILQWGEFLWLWSEQVEACVHIASSGVCRCEGRRRITDARCGRRVYDTAAAGQSASGPAMRTRRLARE